MLMSISTVCSFISLGSTLQYGSVTNYLYIHLMMDIWVASRVCLFVCFDNTNKNLL